jgi:large subunit ribosomal protein L7/L12
MPTFTVAEALAEIETIGRRLDRKQQLVSAHLLRDQQYRDPLRLEGGSAATLTREMETIRALHERKILLRRLIQNAYERTMVTFGNQTRSLADWLAWRRDVSTRQTCFLNTVASHITAARSRAARSFARRSGGLAGDKPGDVIVHLNEQELAQQRETLVELLGYLAGQLTLKNATLTIEAPEDASKTRLEELFQHTPVVKTHFTVQLDGLADPTKKINVIKLVREITNLGLKEAMDMVQGAPRNVKDNIPVEEAEAIRKKLEDGGGLVSLK